MMDINRTSKWLILSTALLILAACVATQSDSNKNYIRQAILGVPTPGGNLPGERLGRQQLWSGNYPAAIVSLTQAVESIPAGETELRAYVLRFRALANAGAGRSTEAIADIDEVVDFWKRKYGYDNKAYLSTQRLIYLGLGKPEPKKN